MAGALLHHWRQTGTVGRANVATALHNMAVIENALGHAETAAQMLNEAIQIDRQTFGLEHPQVAKGHAALASLLRRVDGNQAITHYSIALSIDQSVFGQDHARVGQRLYDLAREHQARENLTEAAPLFQRLSKMRKNYRSGVAVQQAGALRVGLKFKLNEAIGIRRSPSWNLIAIL